MTERPTRDLHEPYPGAWLVAPWPLVSEISETLPRYSWTLVGGLMVQAHAHLQGIPASRATDDVDTVLHLETGMTTFSEVNGLLRNRGFTLEDSHKHAYRFTRHSDEVDVMIADRAAATRQPSFLRRPLFGVPGGTRALSQTANVVLRNQDGSEAGSFSLPSVQGALVLKGAAQLVDTRDQDRHTEDGIVLLACVSDVDEIRAGLSLRSRRRIRALLRAIARKREAWFAQDPETQARARANLSAMESAFDITGTDNSWQQRE